MKQTLIFSLIIIGLVCVFISKPVKSNDSYKECIGNIKDSVTYEATGVIVSKNKAIVKLKMDRADSLPQIDQVGILSKYFENKFGNMNITGWLNIADIKVVSIKGTEINVVVEKELSVTYVNGEKKNHFKPGNEIKITWKNPE
jgi:hypothetical protein